MLQFISFGSGSCGNCYFISNGIDALMIDGGVGIRRLKKYMREYGVHRSQLRGMLITHDHADHIKAAGYVSTEFDLRVFTTEKVREGMMRNYHAMRKVESSRICEVKKGETFQLGSFRITPFDIPHDSNDNCGYCIESEDKVFTIMTDVGAVTDTIREYIGRTNYLVLEANYDAEMLQNGPYPQYLKERIASGTGHLCNSQTAQVLVDCFHEQLQHVWLCHLSAENNHPELARKTVEFKLRQYGIIAGKDFQLDVLRREVPTGPWQLDGDASLAANEMGDLFAQEEAETVQPTKAALFDLDGTIFDTEEQYSQFWGRIGQQYHPEMPDFSDVIKGTTLTQIFGRYFPDPQQQEKIEAELDEWERQMEYPFIAGAEAFIKDLRRHGVKCAVVTSSNQKKMASVAQHVPQFPSLFDCILTSENFSASKPDPDCYLQGAKALGAEIEDCVVFEDAFTGLEAGRRSGIFTVGLATTNSRSAIEDKCDKVFDDFTQLSYEAFTQLKKE